MMFLNTKSALFLALGTLAIVGCAPADGSDDGTSSSEAPLTSGVRLEKSRIEVKAKQKNVNTGVCSVESSTFRITYSNPTFDAGTKVTLHVGDTQTNQEYIGDGFGWGSAHTSRWENVRDLDMSEASSGFTIDVEGHPRGEIRQEVVDGLYQWLSHAYAPEIEFVFRIELPNGKVLWDNRLRRDYSAEGFNPCETGASGFRDVASWGPF